MRHFDPKFTRWLVAKNYCSKNIESICIKAFYYTNWLTNNGLTIKDALYKNLIDYAGYLQEVEHRSKLVTNEHLRAIGHYYDYLKLPNIAHKVQVIGVKKETPLLLTEEELQQIYTAYDGYIYHSYKSYSNKILLGLFIYQAIDIQELTRLELKDLNLQEGTIYLAAGLKSKNSRTVQLEVQQIMDLHKYITEYRNKGKLPHHKCNTDLVFSPQAERKHRLVNQCKVINSMLKEQTQVQGINYKSLPQLRQSRIAIWIKQYGVRKAMYLSGRKRAKNVERLKQIDLEQLTRDIEKFHPLG